ncbi:MAG: glutamate--tRNA ligase [Oscillospiraceae bacterium]|nr:glutamate--tRNA ligase [Oscillospiraceae bacterium]
MTFSDSAPKRVVRTRFAPSPTGFMHVGNLRTALYEFLVAKSSGGRFILRIEDTDRGRLVDGSVDVIFRTLRAAGLSHDEGPDVGGPFGPYVQSERMSLYLPFAEQLVREGHAYYCFCSKERLDSLHIEDESAAGYDRHCRDLSAEEVRENLSNNAPYVIRQKMPLTGETTFDDLVFGRITVPNKELEDQILIKADGYPTYNFANIIDDHLMEITHVVRGSEYLSSTPKYNLLYEAFGWEIPSYVHLPLIQGRNEDGTVSKLSKRHGATGFDDLIAEGFLPEAVVNYIALLGWCPKEDLREIFTLEELIQAFSIDGISKSPATFDYDKLEWFNGEYIRRMSPDEFVVMARSNFQALSGIGTDLYPLLTEILQPRITRFSQITEKLAYINELVDFDPVLFEHKKSKSSIDSARTFLGHAAEALENLAEWTGESIIAALSGVADRFEVKNATVMWPVRIAVTGMAVTPGGAVEALLLLGKGRSLERITRARQRISEKD